VRVTNFPYVAAESESGAVDQHHRTTRSPNREKDASALRYKRYKAVVDRLVERTDFELSHLHEACTDERPAFVTRLVNELVETGWLLREDNSSSQNFRWNKGRGEFSPSRWLDEKLFGTQIKESPQHDRPRERLSAVGALNLRLAELLAILIRSGRPGESAVIAGEKLAREYQSRLQDLATAGRGELKSISPAVDLTAWCQIMAGIELGRRIAAVSERSSAGRITSAAAAIEFCRRHFARLASDARQEEFHVVTLDTKNQVIDTHPVTVGTLDTSLVHPREVFRTALKDAAASVILVHNHPSGDATPSKEDFAVTRRLESAGELLGIKVLDHIVLGSSSATSIREEGSGLSGRSGPGGSV
jgi:DNA repair protein RadC